MVIDFLVTPFRIYHKKRQIWFRYYDSTNEKADNFFHNIMCDMVDCDKFKIGYVYSITVRFEINYLNINEHPKSVIIINNSQKLNHEKHKETIEIFQNEIKSIKKANDRLFVSEKEKRKNWHYRAVNLR